MRIPDVAIDLGTASVLVYVRGRGIAVQEPSIVALQASDSQPVAIGQAALEMLGRTPGSIAVVRPLRGGVVASYELTETMVRYFIRKALGGAPWLRPRVLMAAAPNCTEVEQRALIDACKQAGAREVHLVPQGVATALGVGLGIDRPRGHLIIDVGGGTTDVAVVSAGGEAVVGSVRVAGDEMDDAIRRYVRRQHGLVIGERTAEHLKIQGGTLEPELAGGPSPLTVWGQDGLSGMPRVAQITPRELAAVLREPVESIAAAVHHVLEETPPELAADIADQGGILTGGGALLRGLDHVLSRALGLPVSVVDDPITCLVRGLGRVLEGMQRTPRHTLDRRPPFRTYRAA